MASRNPNPAPRAASTTKPTANRKPARPAFDRDAPAEVVDPRWLLKALALTTIAAVACAYGAVCLLVYQGGWQLLLHPSHTQSHTPSVAFSALRFDAAETGVPRLAGWWIPADQPSAESTTILFLHDGAGDLSDTAHTLDLLHGTDVNVFAFDYRGYGASAGPHPTEARMGEDAGAALEYLTTTRHIPWGSIVPYGQGLGAALAAQLAESHASLPAMVLDSPNPYAFTNALDAGRARLLPMRLLIQDHFDLVSAVKKSAQPKLLLTAGDGGVAAKSQQDFFATVAGPKMVAAVGSPLSEAEYKDSVRRFLIEYLARR